MTDIEEHDIVCLLVPVEDVPAKSMGTVVHIYQTGAYEVEFGVGHVVTVRRDQIKGVPLR